MSMFGNRTGTPAAAAPNAARPMAPQGPPRSKYGGISCAEMRDPMLGLGTYRVRVDACSEGYNPGKLRESFKVTLRVLEALPGSETAPNATVGMVSLKTPAGLSELKRFFMHAAGFGPSLEDRAQGNAKQKLLDGEDGYNALDESHGYQGAIIEASAGVSKSSTAPSIVGRIVDVVVTKGKDVPNPQSGAATGDFFRVYTWGVVPEAEQAAQ